MSQIYVLSIGLNVGDSEPTAQLGQTLSLVRASLGEPLAVGMGKSEWQGVPERFVQIAVLSTLDMIARRVGLLALTLHQECIAVAFPGARQWELLTAKGGIEPGGTLAYFPIILDLPLED